jgi:hypothetical protein
MKERLHAMTQNGLLLDVSESPKKKGFSAQVLLKIHSLALHYFKYFHYNHSFQSWISILRK